MNKVVKKLPGRLCTFLCTGLIGIGVVLFYCILPIAYIIVAAIYWDHANCRAEHLPALLLIGGLLGILCNVLGTIERRNKKSFEKRTSFWLRIVSYIVGLATFCWLIAACILVFRLHPKVVHDEDKSSSGNYCHPFLYGFSFWSLIVILVLLIIHLIVIFSIAFCCAEKIIKKLVKREARAGVANFISNA